MKTTLLILMAVVLGGCAGPTPAWGPATGSKTTGSGVTQAQFEAADYGNPVWGHKSQVQKVFKLVKLKMAGSLIDPNSALYTKKYVTEKGYTKYRGDVSFGWLWVITINAKNRYGGYVGEKHHTFLINDGRIIDQGYMSAFYIGPKPIRGLEKEFPGVDTGPGPASPPDPFVSKLKDFEQDGVKVEFQRVNALDGYTDKYINISVAGIITNVSDMPVSSVFLNLDLIDGEDVKLYGGITSTSNLQPGGKYRFNITLISNNQPLLTPLTVELQKLTIYR